jgi:hypothetical protein
LVSTISGFNANNVEFLKIAGILVTYMELDLLINPLGTPFACFAVKRFYYPSVSNSLTSLSTSWIAILEYVIK